MPHLLFHSKTYLTYSDIIYLEKIYKKIEICDNKEEKIKIGEVTWKRKIKRKSL